MTNRIHLTATRDNRVIGIVMTDAENAIVIDDGTVTGEPESRDEAIAAARMRGGRQSLDRASAEALMAGNTKRAQALHSSAERVLAAASGADKR